MSVTRRLQTSVSIWGWGERTPLAHGGGTPLAASAEGAWHPWVQRDPIAGFDVPWKRLVPITAVGKRPRLCESEPLSLSFKREVRRCHGPARARHTRETQRERVSEPAAEAAPPPSGLLLVPHRQEGPWVRASGALRVTEERSRESRRSSRSPETRIGGDAELGVRSRREAVEDSGAGRRQGAGRCHLPAQQTRASGFPAASPFCTFSAHPASRPCGRRGARRRRDRMTAAGSQLQRPRGFVGETSTQNDVEDVRGPRSRRGAASRTIETIRRELTNSANGALAGKEVDVAKELK